MVFSIDQNCHPLWDAIPKLHALTRAGHRVHHFVEDIDVAFTSVGASVGDPNLRFAPERFHASGGSDWGAAIFYSEFLSKQPTDLRQWEPMLGMSLGAIARRLGTTVADLYDAYSPSGNYQLIGTSYVGDRDHHRLLGDLSIAEVSEHLRELMGMAERDMTRCFPSSQSRARLTAWFGTQRHTMEQLIEMHHGQSLDALYRTWMMQRVPDNATIRLTSDAFTLGVHPDQLALLNHFVTDYTTLADLYDEAMREGNTGQHSLRRDDGELPFYAVFMHEGHFVRAECALRDGAIHVAKQSFMLAEGTIPIATMRDAGIRCLVGKAALLTILARLPKSGAPLALPYHGSMYMPASFALQRGLQRAGFLPGPLHPVLRVQFSLLDRLGEVDIPITLPDYLARAIGETTLPSRTIAEQWRQWKHDAEARLEMYTDETRRAAWLADAYPSLDTQRRDLDARRRSLANTDPKSAEIRELSHEVKAIDDLLLRHLLDQVAKDWQVAQIDFWDSRGAIEPWCIALGGEAFYQSIIDRASIYPDVNNPTP